MWAAGGDEPGQEHQGWQLLRAQMRMACDAHLMTTCCCRLSRCRWCSRRPRRRPEPAACAAAAGASGPLRCRVPAEALGCTVLKEGLSRAYASPMTPLNGRLQAWKA